MPYAYWSTVTVPSKSLPRPWLRRPGTRLASPRQVARLRLAVAGGSLYSPTVSCADSGMKKCWKKSLGRTSNSGILLMPVGLLREDLVELHLIVGARRRVLHQIVELGLIVERGESAEARVAVADVVRDGLIEVLVELARVGKRKAVAARLTADRAVAEAVVLRRLRGLVNDRFAERFVRAGCSPAVRSWTDTRTESCCADAARNFPARARERSSAAALQLVVDRIKLTLTLRRPLLLE